MDMFESDTIFAERNWLMGEMNLRTNIPKKHHYIPRFLIRPFCDEKGLMTYEDKKTGIVSKKRPEEVFMSRNLYRDTINNPRNPVQIEDDLSHFEEEASRIIKKFYEDNEVTITCEEEERLKVFLAIMGFRAERTQQYFSQANEEDEEFYSFYQEDGNLADFWKRNLGALVNCRSIEEVMRHKHIDSPIKMFIKRDIIGISGTYIMAVEREGTEDFLLSDCYPLVVEGSAEIGLKLQEYFVFPISPQRAIMIVYHGVENAPKAGTGFGGRFFQEPTISEDGKILKIRIKKIHDDNVKSINKMIYENATEGVVVQKCE